MQVFEFCVSNSFLFYRDQKMKTAEELGVCTKMQRKLKSTIRKAMKHRYGFIKLSLISTRHLCYCSNSTKILNL